MARELRWMWDFLDGEPVTRIAATLGGRLAATDRYGEAWTAERVSDLVMASRDGKPLLVAPQRRLAYLGKLLDALPAEYRRADRVTAERRAAAKVHAERAAARRVKRDQQHTVRAAAAVVTDRGRIARRVALYLARPATAATGACIGGCGTTGPDVAPRESGRRTVPLCEGCWAVVEAAQ